MRVRLPPLDAKEASEPRVAVGISCRVQIPILSTNKMKTDTFTNQRLYAVHLQGWPVRWVLARSPQEALQVAESKVGAQVVADFDPKVAARPLEFREAQKQVERKIEKGGV